MTTDVTIARDVLQKTFDTAVNSMDFGSGFLDDEEVTALRSVAVVLGVDPLVATPIGFQCKYLGAHEWDHGPYRFGRIVSADSDGWHRAAGLVDPQNDTMTRVCGRCQHREIRPLTAKDLP